jgi:hypothetical protein
LSRASPGLLDEVEVFGRRPKAGGLNEYGLRPQDAGCLQEVAWLPDRRTTIRHGQRSGATHPRHLRSTTPFLAIGLAAECRSA